MNWVEADDILIFGGTFDPPHVAHSRLPPVVADQLGCDRILYVPAAVNPLKQNDPPTEVEHRLAMLSLALADVPNAEICTLELERSGPSYMIDTLRELDRLAAEAGRIGERELRFRLLIGADQAVSFHLWRDWEEILQLAEPVVMLRPPYDHESFREQLSEHYKPAMVDYWMEHLVQTPRLNVSATVLRDKLEKGGSFDEHLEPAVAEYIRHHGLYESRINLGQR